MLGTSFRRARKDVPQLLLVSLKPGLLQAEKQLCFLKIRPCWIRHPHSEAPPGPSEGRYRQFLGGGPQRYQRQAGCSPSGCLSASSPAILSPWAAVMVLLPLFTNLCSSRSPTQVWRRRGCESPPRFPGAQSLSAAPHHAGGLPAVHQRCLPQSPVLQAAAPGWSQPRF